MVRMTVLLVSASTILACHDANPDPRAPPSPPAPVATADTQASQWGATNTMPFEATSNTATSPLPTTPPLPLEQPPSDATITQAIRRALVADEALSLAAKNVKVISSDGKVVLSGVVRSERERANVEAKAVAMAGVTAVDNQLEVKP